MYKVNYSAKWSIPVNKYNIPSAFYVNSQHDNACIAIKHIHNRPLQNTSTS